MVLSDQRTPYSIMYVWAAFEAKSPPTRQDLVTIINNYIHAYCISHCYECRYWKTHVLDFFMYDGNR